MSTVPLLLFVWFLLFRELSAEFVKDETIPDGTIVSPGQQLEKSWVMRNNGTMTWPSTTVVRIRSFFLLLSAALKEVLFTF